MAYPVRKADLEVEHRVAIAIRDGHVAFHLWEIRGFSRVEIFSRVEMPCTMPSKSQRVGRQRTAAKQPFKSNDALGIVKDLSGLAEWYDSLAPSRVKYRLRAPGR